MEEVLINLLSLDKDFRDKADLYLNQIKASNPAKYCEGLLSVLDSGSEENIKLVSIVLLRQSLPGLWNSLENDFKVVVKSKLLACITCMNSWNLAKNLACAISELAIGIIQSSTGEKWPSILSSVITPLQGDNSYTKFISFLILSEIIPYFCETFAKLKRKLVPIYIKHLQSPLPQLRFIVIHSLTVYISVINTSETGQYAETIKPLFSSVHYLCLEYPEYSQNCLKSLKELAESEPLYFKQDFSTIFSFFEELRKNSLVFVKVALMEFIVSLIGKHRSSLLDKREYLVSISNGVLESLVETAPGLMNGGENSEQKCLVKVLRKLVGCIGESIVDYLLKSVEQGLGSRNSENEDFVVMVVLGELCQFIYNTDKIEVILNGFNSFIGHQNAAKRWAAFRLIEKLVKIPDKVFRDSLQGSVLGLLKGGLADTEELITKKVLKILLVVIQFTDSKDLSKYFPEFIPLVLKSIKKSNCIQISLEILTECCVKCKKLLSESFPQLFLYFFQVVNEVESWVKVKILDLLVSLRKIVGKETYLEHLDKVFMVFQSVNQENENCAGNKALVVISKYLKKDVRPYLYLVVPDLFSRLNGEVVVEDGLEVVMALVDSAEEEFLQYSEKTLEYLLRVTKNDLSDSGKLLASHITSKLCNLIVKNSKGVNPSQTKDFKQLLSEFWNWSESELDLETLLSILNEIRTLIDNLSMFSAEETSEFSSKILKIVQTQHHSSTQLKKKSDSTIFQILHTLFQNPTGATLHCLQSTFISIHSKMLSQQFPEPDILFIFTLIQNTILHLLPYFSLLQIESFLNTIDHFLKFPQYKLKKSCLKTLTLIHVNLNKDLFSKAAPIILAQLESVLVPVKDSKRIVDQKVKDLVLISIGQLIKYKFDCISLELLIPWWASHLPINSHKSQAKILHDFLADLALHLPFLHSNPQILSILLTVSFTDLCASYTLPKLTQLIQSQTVPELNAGLSDKLKKLQVFN